MFKGKTDWKTVFEKHYLPKNFCADYMKNCNNSIVKRQTIQQKKDQIICINIAQQKVYSHKHVKKSSESLVFRVIKIKITARCLYMVIKCKSVMCN